MLQINFLKNIQSLKNQNNKVFQMRLYNIRKLQNRKNLQSVNIKKMYFKKMMQLLKKKMIMEILMFH